MQPSIRKATFIVCMWTDSDLPDDNAWRGTAELIGSGQLGQFQTLDDFIIWLRQELAKTDYKRDHYANS